MIFFLKLFFWMYCSAVLLIPALVEVDTSLSLMRPLRWINMSFSVNVIDDID